MALPYGLMLLYFYSDQPLDLSIKEASAESLWVTLLSSGSTGDYPANLEPTILIYCLPLVQ